MNETQIRYSFELLKDEEIIEVRIIAKNGKTYSGYFKSADAIVPEIKRFDGENIYFVLNKISDACYSREQRDRVIEVNKREVTTSDNDITSRKWFLIDIDPKRPTGVGATEQEKQWSKNVANKIYSYLRDFGFSYPIVCDSGNGSHLLYKIDMPNDEASKTLLQTCLQVLDLYFTDIYAEVDKTVFNASRITKLYGTIASKGKNTADRPHRESRIIKVPDVVKITPTELFIKLAAIYPQPEKRTYSNNYGQDQFNLNHFISKHSIQLKAEQSFQGGTKYILNNCLFNEQHKNKDAMLFQLGNGAIGYKCLHNSCSSYKWQDVRKLFEPDAYSIKQSEYKQQRDIKPLPTIPQVKIVDKGNKFLKFNEIENVDRSKIISIPTGYKVLDKRIIGVNKGEVSLWSGKNGSAKSTILNQIAINGIESGFKTAIYSGELTPQRLKNWTHLQCAGKQYTHSTQYENLFYVQKHIGEKIDEWLSGNLLVYNNSYGHRIAQMLVDIKEVLNESNVEQIILDNVMSFELDEFSGDKYGQQSKMIRSVVQLAQNENIHIHIVAHPRKSVTFLRKDDISGTADLTNSVDNVFICHRVNNDFNRAVADFYGKQIASDLFGYSNVIEVCKNRDLGIQDELFGFYFEVESKRLLNEKYENVVYGWQDIATQQIIPTFYSGIKPNYDFYSNINVNETIEEAPF